MAIPKHVAVALDGTDAIAEWMRLNGGEELDLTDADLRGANLRGARLRGARMGGVNLSDVDMRDADLYKVWLARADLSRADLSKAKLSLAYLTKAKLGGANLVEAELNFAVLFDADLTDADLTGAKLGASRLTYANLSEANLSRAELIAVDFQDANLSDAILTEADLSLANLDGTKLVRTQMSNATLGKTSLVNLDMSKAEGIESVIHVAPSSVGVDTLVASFRGAGNRIPKALREFFREAGMPVELLEELPRIIAEVKYYSCFISYGQPDLEIAQKLTGDLKSRGVSAWLYDMDSTVGERTWREVIERRREAEKMVVLCSAGALVRNGVLKEIEEQIDEDPDKIVPISLDDIWKQPGFRVMRGSRDLKPFLLDRNYADFANLDYAEALERLLDGLRLRPKRKRKKG